MKKLAPLAVVATLLSTTALADVTISGTSEFYYKDVDSQIASQNGDSMGNSDNEIKFSFSNKTETGLDYGMVVEMSTVAGVPKESSFLFICVFKITGRQMFLDNLSTSRRNHRSPAIILYMSFQAMFP